MSTALITGVTGQDGAYLAQCLLDKGYRVVGIKRRSSSFNTDRVDHFYDNENFTMEYGDLTDIASLMSVLQAYRPQEIYNLGAQSHVRVSFDIPVYTGQVTALGATNLLESIRQLGMESSVRYYQASSSEMFGQAQEMPQSETTPFYPRSPYGVAKLYAYWMTINYREAYAMHASNGILFNHESPLRGETFVTRKVTQAVIRISKGQQSYLSIGNLEAQRDWGHARDYAEAQWLILQQDVADDYVIATGEMHSVRELVEYAFKCVDIDIAWEGEGLDERGINTANSETVVAVDRKYYRPAEVDRLLGDASKASRKLGWKPQYSFYGLIDEMIEAERDIL